MNDASPAALASTLPPPPYALSDLEQDAVLAVTLGAELAAEAVIKVCSCGREHTEQGWSALSYCGVQADGDERFELRHCACGSTIAIQLCIVDGCGARPVWKTEAPTLADYCDEHATEWLMAERGCPPHDFRDGDVCSKCDSLRGR